LKGEIAEVLGLNRDSASWGVLTREYELS